MITNTHQFIRDTRSFFRNLPEMIEDFFIGLQVRWMKERVLRRKLEDLTDYTLIDRIEAGEKEKLA